MTKASGPRRPFCCRKNIEPDAPRSTASQGKPLRTVYSPVARSFVSYVCRLAQRHVLWSPESSGQSRGHAAGSTGEALGAPAPATPVAGGTAVLQDRSSQLWRHPAAITAARCRPDAPCAGALGPHSRGAARCPRPDRGARLGPPGEQQEPCRFLWSRLNCTRSCAVARP